MEAEGHLGSALARGAAGSMREGEVLPSLLTASVPGCLHLGVTGLEERQAEFTPALLPLLAPGTSPNLYL